MDKKITYYRQVQLLLELLPFVARHECFALKGGTAINLFVRDLPRLSVDIDLVFLPSMSRNDALSAIKQQLDLLASSVESQIADARVSKSYSDNIDALRLIVDRQGVKVKIELSPVLRGTVYEPRIIPVSKAVENEFGFAETLVVDPADLYAGKICAALDRQHPRDLFDIKYLLDNEGLTESLRKALIVYIVSHPRPIAELLSPHLKDISGLYFGEFVNMAEHDVSIIELEATRTTLINTINQSLTSQEREFLISFKRCEPNWKLLGLQGIENLPAVQWKLLNLTNMKPDKHSEAILRLRSILNL